MSDLKPNSYSHHISKEQLNALPLVQFTGDVYVIDHPDMLHDAVQYLSVQTVIGVDTESRPSFTRGVHYPTALLQIATLDRCYLFRLTHIGLPEELAALFSNPRICKVGLAFKDDLKGLRRRHDFDPHHCIDIQAMVGDYGILELGLQKIFAIIYGQKISKTQQMTNWENSHLTPEQARYASTDAWATLLIYNDLITTQPLEKREAESLHRADLEVQKQRQQEIRLQREEHQQQTDHVTDIS